MSLDSEREVQGMRGNKFRTFFMPGEDIQTIRDTAQKVDGKEGQKIDGLMIEHEGGEFVRYSDLTIEENETKYLVSKN